MFRCFIVKTLLLKSVNMFERMEIAESIYEGFVETSYKKTTGAYFNRSGHSRKMRGEANSSTTYSNMSESTGKRRKRYVDHLKDRSRLTCLFHIPGHSSVECKVLGDFGSKYSERRPTKNHGQDTTKMNKFNRKQEKNSMDQHAVY